MNDSIWKLILFIGLVCTGSMICLYIVLPQNSFCDQPVHVTAPNSCPLCPSQEREREREALSSSSYSSSSDSKTSSDPKTKQNNFIPPAYYQVFPIERYPGMQCYVIATSKRYLVLTQNCISIYSDQKRIYIGQYVIERQTPDRICDRCYLSDYLNVISFILFGKPEQGIAPLAPNGALLLEDDIAICKSALDYLDECYKGQYNCFLGGGAWMNFYAGPNTTQPDKKHAKNRFTSVDQLYDHPGKHTKEWYMYHIDCYLKHHRILPAVSVEKVNHMGVVSVMGHGTDFPWKCSMNDTLVNDKTTISRTQDLVIDL